MVYYITRGGFQEHLREYYKRTNNMLQVNEAASHMYKKGLLSPQCPPEFRFRDAEEMSDEEFLREIDRIPMTVVPTRTDHPRIQEEDMFPERQDIFIFRHFQYTRKFLHRHDYFEVDYVMHGACTFFFKKEARTMQEGEVCIIAPDSDHDIQIMDDETAVFSILIRKSTFNTTFFRLLTQKNPLSYFFKTILSGKEHTEYLLFFVDKDAALKRNVRGLMQEFYTKDGFRNECCISSVNLFFAKLLRNYSKTVSFYEESQGTDFSLVLQYIQYHYATVTLASLAEFFHYNKAYLCVQIRKNTGLSFSELLKQLKMSHAVDYLCNTNLKVYEICENIGYRSVDHFSRLFHEIYQMSPTEYRRKYQVVYEEVCFPMSRTGAYHSESEAP